MPGRRGDVAQLAEHLLCKQGAVGSSPIVSTKNSLLNSLLNTVVTHITVQRG